MKGRQIVLLALLVVAAAAVLWLARANRAAPKPPSDRTHAEASAPDGCLVCHGPGGAQPRPRSHPPGRDCWRCHMAR